MATTKIPSESFSGSCEVVFKVWAGCDEAIRAINVAGAGSVGVSIFSVSPSDQPGKLKFIAALGAGEISENFYVDVPAAGEDPTEFRRTFSWSLVGASVDTTVRSTPIGDKQQTHAKEGIAADAWGFAANPQITISFGDLTGTFDVFGSYSLSMTFGSVAVDPDAWGEYGKYMVSFENCQFCGNACDFGAFTARNFGGQSDLWVEGSGSTIGLWGGSHPLNYYTWEGTTATAPLVYDFSGLHVRNMDGADLDDLEVWCSGVRDIDTEAHADLGPAKHTCAEWRALGTITQRYGLFTADPNPPDLEPQVVFYIDLDSARQHDLEGFGSGSDVAALSFSHDARGEIEGWLLSAASRSEQPWRTDIAQLTHRGAVAVYAEALNHASWVASNGTAPDDNGYFTITADDGSLRLDLPNNYEARQAAVAQGGAVPVPDAYWYRIADHYYPDEPHEALWDWRGFGYLYLTLDAPAAVTLTLTLGYYSEETFGDNHLSDGTRQSEYTYNPGELHTFTVSSAVAAGAGREVCFDLFNDRPLALVKSLTISFSETGDYRLKDTVWEGTAYSGPVLSQDRGDQQTGRPAPEQLDPPQGHAAYKEFEHFAYCEGGVSASNDGDFRRALWWPDNFKRNTLELTGGHLNVAIGAGTGEDLTRPFSLEQYLGLMQSSGNAWQTSFNQAAHDDATMDDQGGLLKVLSCFDLSPLNGDLDGQGNGQLPVCLRVGEWDAVNGLKYVWQVKKYVSGRAHGRVTPPGSNTRLRNQSAGVLWRRKLGSADNWQEVQLIASDTHALWNSNGLPVEEEYVDGAPLPYEYDTGQTLAKIDPALATRLATREWAEIDAVVLLVWDPFLTRELHLHAWRIAEYGGNCYVEFIDHAETVAPQLVGQPFSGGVYARPSLAIGEDGAIYACATNTVTGNMEVVRSRTSGKDWGTT